jgi:hypothetical protein
MSESRHSVRFPGESESHRAARSELLEAETQLRRNVEAVAAKRRDLPLGGMVSEDYVFDEAAFGSAERKVGLSELFADGKDTLIVHSFMYGPKMAQPCVSCTSMLDALDGGSALMVNPQFEHGPPTMFICGNDDAAKTTVSETLDQFGWETADMGKIEAARAIEPLCILWCVPGFLSNEWTHAFKLLR